MAIKTISQIRTDIPTVTLAGSDYVLVEQASKTVAATLAELKDFVKPALATITTDGLMSAADKVKLNNSGANATQNQTDSYLLSRDNHTGVQNIGTITGLQDSLTALSSATSNNAMDIDNLEDDVVDIYVELGKKLESVNVAGVTGLTAALSAKLDKASPTPTGTWGFPTYTVSGKPSASANEGRWIEISNASDGPTLCRSNGTKWIVVAFPSGTEVKV